MRTNYLGSVWCLRAFLPGLEAAAPADVVNIVSVAGTIAVPQSGAYAASKHAQLAFSTSDRRAAPRSRGIRVHTVKPGYVETEGFPQAGCPRRLQRLVVGPDRIVSTCSARSSTVAARRRVPRYYGRRRRRCRPLFPNLSPACSPVPAAEARIGFR